MFLKRLELQGFKSFAPRTILEFNSGITAIVGSNGSGKSNLADAMRWVLGEQSIRQLRGKKSDDVIFVGGLGRAPMQMAEVGLVLDNTEGWLPTERAEVSAARRSFRSGESEYLVSGQRVRLRDLLLLLAQARIGHDSYTVIGQGLVDQALSARPEERRGLFEDAAGIRQFQAQRADAEQKLGLTQTNLARLRDILAEIEPRLGPLAEQARRARDYVATREELRRLIRVWYTWQWEQLETEDQRAAAEATALGQRIENITQALANEDSQVRQTRQAREELVARLAQLRRARGETSGRVQTHERDLAVAQERRASLDRQAADLEGDLRQQQNAVNSRQEHLRILEEQATTAEELTDTMQAALDTLEREQHAMRQEQEREEARLRAVQRDMIQTQARLGATQTELGRLHKQLGERNRTLATRQEAADSAMRRAETMSQALAGALTQFDGAHAEVEAVAASHEALRRECSERQAEFDRLHGVIADAERTRGALVDHLTLLRSWHNDFEGHEAAVRTLAQAAVHERPPFAGILARLIRPHEGYEQAAAAALGPFLQAVVAESAQQAVDCADWLRQRGAGYALFLWPDLDAATAQMRTATVNTREGLQPLAAYITIEPRFQSLLDRLLRNVFVVDSLDATAYGTLEGADADGESATMEGKRRPTITVITLAGELLHRDGWLRGGGTGAPASETPRGERSATPQNLLVHERELQELPPAIERVAEQLEVLRRQQETLSVDLTQSQTSAAELDQTLHEIEARAQSLARQVTEARREEERAQHDAQLAQAMMDQLRAELAGIEEEVVDARLRALEQEERQSQAAEAVSSVQEALDDMVARNRAEQEALARQRTTLAVQRQEAKTLAQRVDQVRAQSNELAAQLTRTTERLQTFATQRAEVDAATVELQDAIATLREQQRELAGEVGECEASLAHTEGLLAQADRDQAVARQELSTVEAEYRHAIVAAQRAHDAVETLSAQLRDEAVELGELSLEATVAEALTLLRRTPTSDAAAQTDDAPHTTLADHSTPEGAAKARRQIDQLRSRMRQLGGFDPDAPQAYEELKARHDFLSSQVRDMEQGATNLRAIIVELDATMRRQFTETFAAVNVRFQRHFTVLFSGGTARLEMTAPRRPNADESEDGDGTEPGVPTKGIGVGGIEVFVQIPGKRIQDLSLLSGGERAMVSVALLFALLETNPPPFCLLDEVDAALDEANVVRFCDILQQLASSTQFIVITHNRVTMTYASAIYGVSMGDDSVSRILSMRLADVPVTR